MIINHPTKDQRPPIQHERNNPQKWNEEKQNEKNIHRRRSKRNSIIHNFLFIFVISGSSSQWWGAARGCG